MARTRLKRASWCTVAGSNTRVDVRGRVDIYRIRILPSSLPYFDAEDFVKLDFGETSFPVAPVEALRLGWYDFPVPVAVPEGAGFAIHVRHDANRGARFCLSGVEEWDESDRGSTPPQE